MPKLFEPSSSELMRQIKAAEAKCDGDIEQTRLRTVAADEALVRAGKLEAREFVERHFEALYEKHLHEMPYGTAKARDGDPYVWLENHYS